MDSKQPATKTSQHQHTHPVYPGDYPTNPFATALTGVKTFWANGRGVLAGIIGLEFLLLLGLWLVAAITVVAGMVLLLSTVAEANFSNSLTPMLPESLISASNALMYAGPASGIILLVGIALIVTTGVFTHALQLSLVGKTVTLRQKPTFGQVVKTAFKRMWALIAQTFLLGLMAAGIALTTGFFLALLVNQNPAFILLVILVYLALMVAGVYFFARLAFAGLGVVVHNLGPWQALQHSFELTKGRAGEVFGIGAVAFVAVVAMGLITNILAYGSASLDIPVVTVIAFLVIVLLSLVSGFLFTAMLAERYAQFTSIAQTKADHKTEWGSIVAAIALAVFSVLASGLIQYAIFPEMPQDTTPPGLNTPTPDFYDPDQSQELPGFDPNITEDELQQWLNSQEDPTTGEPLLQ